jgi:hypothetical protein
MTDWPWPLESATGREFKAWLQEDAFARIERYRRTHPPYFSGHYYGNATDESYAITDWLLDELADFARRFEAERATEPTP